MFDSSTSPKAEPLPVSPATTLTHQPPFLTNFRVKNKIKFLTKVVPTRFSKQISNIGEKGRSSLHSPHVLRVPAAGRGLARAARRSPLVHGRPGARVPALRGGQVPRAALPLRSSGGLSVTAALSVCVNQTGGSFPLPAADFPFV